MKPALAELSTWCESSVKCAEIEYNLVDVCTQQTSSVQLQVDHLQTRVKTSAIFCTSNGLLLELLVIALSAAGHKSSECMWYRTYTSSKLL
jgi:hypothetical protein